MARTRSLRFRSGVGIRGELTIHVFDARTGAVLRTLNKPNTIMNNARDIVRALLAQRALGAGGDPVAIREYSWGSMRFGTDSTAAAPTQQDLYGEVTAARKELTDIQKNNGSVGEITLTATLDSGDANGVTLREAGVFTRGPTVWSAGVGGTLRMFSRQVHPFIEKTSAIRLEYTWVFQFTA